MRTVDLDTIKSTKIYEATLDALKILKADKEKKLLDEFEEKLGSRFAVNGAKPTLKALMKGQARILLVAEGFSSPGFICPESGVLLMEKQQGLCPEGIEPLAVVDVVDDAMEEAFRQNTEIEILFNEEASEKIDGMGTILRFKL
jgi:peptide subunit release factor 1 (eRF1)